MWGFDRKDASAVSSSASISDLLPSSRNGDSASQQRLFSDLYERLRGLARKKFRGERQGHTLQPTALVHEVFVRLTSGLPIEFQDRVHFLAVAARAMERVLIDYAKKRNTIKRAEPQRTPLEADEVASPPDGIEEAVAVAECLQQLETQHPRRAQVVRLRYFAGLTIEETAVVLEVTDNVVNRDWQLARLWLRRVLCETGAEPLE